MIATVPIASATLVAVTGGACEEALKFLRCQILRLVDFARLLQEYAGEGIEVVDRTAHQFAQDGFGGLRYRPLRWLSRL